MYTPVCKLFRQSDMLTEISYILGNILAFESLVVPLSLAPLSTIFTSRVLPWPSPPSFIVYATCILFYGLLAYFLFLCILSSPAACLLHVLSIGTEQSQIKAVTSHAKLCISF